jgi:sulfite exporter TauE/SafE
MLASINPLGERARGTRFSRTFVWYLAGSIGGGAVIGAALGAIGAGLRDLVDPSRTAIALAVVVVCAIGIAVDLRVANLHLPSPRRQVNENWLAIYRGWLYGLGFGFQLGLAVVTLVATAAVYVMMALAVLSGSMLGGIIIGCTFGAVRALPLLSVGRVHEPGELRSVMRRMQGLARVADSTARVAVVLLGATAIVATMT